MPLVVLLISCGLAGGCAATFGPGYTVNTQGVDVHFEPGPPPHISIDAKYELTNTGTRPLSALELRLPARRRFKSSDVSLEWDGQGLSVEQSAANPRNSIVTLPSSWTMMGHHSLHVKMDLQTSTEGESHLGFAPDAFFLPAQGWAPELLPARGLFATGGAPPARWDLTVHVPREFVIHVSGEKIKTSKHENEVTVRATQRVADIYPYVIAGRYVTKQIGSEREKIYLWTRKAEDPGDLRTVSDSLVKTLQSYDAVFGGRTIASPPAGFLRRHKGPGMNEPPLWLVECPVIPGCFSNENAARARLFSDDSEGKSGEMISLDSAVIDPSPGVKKIASAAGPALAASWLGYGQSPSFYEQEAPLAAFPAFAAAVGTEALNGPGSRAETIRRALAAVPQNGATLEKTNSSALRAKSFLFFYALQDRYGNDVFRKAVRHMLYARRSSGFDLDDLIAAFDEESHGNVAEFVRLWMKHPGVPKDFRAKYENTSANKNAPSKEVTP
jgi:hypothetical protein